MPQVIVIDEIGTELEAQAARTIAERGVQLIGTAHGNNLDNLMLNPTLSDLIGGIQSVTLGDEEARRRRSQKSVLERKAAADVRRASSRSRTASGCSSTTTWPRPSTRCCSASPSRPSSAGATRRASTARSRGPSRRRGRRRAGDRFSGLTGSGAGAWGREPGLARRRDLPHRRLRGRGPPARRDRGSGRAQSGGWRSGRGGSGRRIRALGSRPASGRATDRAPLSVLPGERPSPVDRPADARSSPATSPTAGRSSGRRARPRAAAAEVRARDARELQRQQAWRDEATRALNALREDEGTRPVNADELEAAEEARIARDGARARRRDVERVRRRRDDEDDDGVRRRRRGPPIEGGTLPTLRVFPHGISRKRLEQAIRDLQLPVIIAREPGRGGRGDDAPLASTARSRPRCARSRIGRSRSTSSSRTRSRRCRPR